jgi:hypothetical protein
MHAKFCGRETHLPGAEPHEERAKSPPLAAGAWGFSSQDRGQESVNSYAQGRQGISRDQSATHQ